VGWRFPVMLKAPWCLKGEVTYSTKGICHTILYNCMEEWTLGRTPISCLPHTIPHGLQQNGRFEDRASHPGATRHRGPSQGPPRHHIHVQKRPQRHAGGARCSRIDPRVVITHKGEDGTSSTRRPTKFSNRHLAAAFSAASYDVFSDLEDEGRSAKDMTSREKAERLTSQVQKHLGRVFQSYSMSDPKLSCGLRNVLVWDNSAPSQASLRGAIRSDNFTSSTLEHVIFGVSRMSRREIAWLHQSLSQEEDWGEIRVRFPELQDMIDDGN
jgi:hypothetical protein